MVQNDCYTNLFVQLKNLKNMVRIVNYNERKSEDGSAFFTLVIQGGMEFIKSKETDNFYATARKTSITSTFDEDTCKALIGTEIPGIIVKQDCAEYEYTIKETNEVITLSHKYTYMPDVLSDKELSSATIDDFLTEEPLSVSTAH